MVRINLTVHPEDNVTTILDSRIGDRTTGDGLVLIQPIPFGHKVARVAIAKGQPVIKYGVTIGIATQNITAGEHVHVQNCS